MRALKNATDSSSHSVQQLIACQFAGKNRPFEGRYPTCKKTSKKSKAQQTRDGTVFLIRLGYPDSIFVCHLRYKVTQEEFRPRKIPLATALVNANISTAEELAELCHRRWSVELPIRSLKTQMQMDHTRCKSPQMVRKEFHCHMIGYNWVGCEMLASALRCRS
ncbi:transposase [Aporhodopirellula aestuarii]|uniref:Transposase n=1 Tax=Aporhodopirellula aestuarii TaxID=2950107 RepID=A0ABT0UA55_9BACT|nr:transposase [Aporhodopirellula aestuarii]MCM2373697.1 transposase [Aporhodopirellula aestuarii]